MAIHPFPRPARALALGLWGMVAIGCAERPTDNPSGTPGVVVTALSRSAAPGPSVRSVPALSGPPIEAARRELLARVPSAIAETSDAGSLLGTDTQEPLLDGGAPTGEASATATDGGPSMHSHVSMVGRPGRPGPAIEKLLRTTVYFDLVNRCRDASGAILPPEAVILGFELDAAGAIIDGTIKAEPKDPRHEPAAQCMIRELTASSFRAPPATKGESTNVTMPIPSVD